MQVEKPGLMEKRTGLESAIIGLGVHLCKCIKKICVALIDVVLTIVELELWLPLPTAALPLLRLSTVPFSKGCLRNWFKAV